MLGCGKEYVCLMPVVILTPTNLWRIFIIELRKKTSFIQAEDGIRHGTVTGVQTCALPICRGRGAPEVAFALPDHDAIRVRRLVERFSHLLFAERHPCDFVAVPPPLGRHLSW